MIYRRSTNSTSYNENTVIVLSSLITKSKFSITKKRASFEHINNLDFGPTFCFDPLHSAVLAINNF